MVEEKAEEKPRTKVVVVCGSMECDVEVRNREKTLKSARGRDRVVVEL